MRRPPFAPLVLALLAGACRVVPASPDGRTDDRRVGTQQVIAGDTLRLAIGQTATVPGTPVEVTVTGVPKDDRCPVESLVQCVWAGDAVVTLRLAAAGETRDVSLHTGVEPRRVALAGHVVELVGLTPERRVDETPRADAYRVAVRVYPGAIAAPGQGTLGDTTRIMVGREATFDGGALRVAFLARGSESRCPANAICIQVGDASATVRLEGAGQSVERVLHTNVEPRSAEHAGYLVELVALDPYPGTEPPNARLAPTIVVRVAKR